MFVSHVLYSSLTLYLPDTHVLWDHACARGIVLLGKNTMGYPHHQWGKGNNIFSGGFLEIGKKEGSTGK